MSMRDVECIMSNNDVGVQLDIHVVWWTGLGCVMHYALCHFKGSSFTIVSVNCKSALLFSQVCDYTEVANAWSQHLKLTSCLPHLQALPQQDVEHI